MSKSRSKGGKVYLVGAGPGDLGLVTLRAKERIERADVIVYDHLANPEMLGWARDDAEIVYAGKKAGEHALTQDEINELLVEKARAGREVVRLKGGDPFVFGRGAEEAKAIVDAGIALERWATTERQETLIGTLENIAQRVAEAEFEAPAVAVFGDVVALRKDLNWYERRPLSGKRIVVTRTRNQAGALTSQLRALGADVFELPTIRIEPPTDLREFAELVQDAHQYDWIVFTSPNGVDAFFQIFYKLYDDAREIGAAKIAAIGPATAQRVRDFRLHVDLQPEEF